MQLLEDLKCTEFRDKGLFALRRKFTIWRNVDVDISA